MTAAAIILLILTVSLINSVNSNLQQTFVVNSIGEVAQSQEFNVLFECGAETGSVVPPFSWDLVWGRDSSIQIDSTTVHSGSRSIKQTTDISSGLSDGYYTARADITYAEAGSRNEFYLSFWFYLPTSYDVVSGGWDFVYESHFEDSRHNWWDWLSVGINKQGSNLIYMWSIGNDVWSRNPSVTIPKNEWVHFQVHVKLGTSNGVFEFWQNDVKVFGASNVNTMICKGGTANKFSSIELKAYPSSSCQDRMTKYVDDIVVASSKVPSSYRVVGK
jgi:hypothetical protein